MSKQKQKKSKKAKSSPASTKPETAHAVIELTVKPDDKDPFRRKQQLAVGGEEAKPPKSIPIEKMYFEIDMTPARYQKTKTRYIKKQSPFIRPHVNEFIRWLKSLDALSVYDALEKGETVKDKYDQRRRFNPIRITVIAARGLLKGSKGYRARAEEAISLELARLVVRFENPEVYQVLKLFDPKEEFLRQNIHATKQILGLIEAD